MECPDVIPPWLDVLGNDVILRKIETMVTYADLKALRVVTPRLNEIVLGKSKFVSRTTFKLTEAAINDKVLANIGFNVQQVVVSLFYADNDGNNSDICNWDEVPEEEVKSKPAIVTKTWNPEDVEHIYEKLGGVQKLAIHDHDLHNKSSATQVIYPNVKRILQSPSCLKKLKLDWKLHVSASILKDFDEQIQECLQHLTELEIVPMFSAVNIARSIRNLSRLEKITIFSSQIFEDPTVAYGEYITSLIELMRNSRNTLESIMILEPEFWQLDEDSNSRISDINFPKLKEVGARFEEHGSEEVLTFLQRHSSQLTSVYVRALGVLTRSFMDLFEEVGPQLKVLRIELKEFANPVANQFSFLQDCSHLEEFTLYFVPSAAYEPNGDSLPVIFDSIPSHVLKLRLGELPNPLCATISSEKLGAFKKIKSLELLNCRWAVDNAVVRVIFEKLTSLQELRLTGISQCNDEGLAALKADGTKDNVPSISDLKGLVRLTIQNSGISEKGLLEAFKFTNLQFLDISENDNVKNSVWKELLSQNPSLEVLRLSNAPEYANPEEEKMLKERFPRLCQIQNQWEATDDEDNSMVDWGGESSISGGPGHMADHNDDFLDEFDDMIDDEDYFDYNDGEFDDDEFGNYNDDY